MRDLPTNHSESEELTRCLMLGSSKAEPEAGVLVHGNNEGVALREGGARRAEEGKGGR